MTRENPLETPRADARSYGEILAAMISNPPTKVLRGMYAFSLLYVITAGSVLLHYHGLVTFQIYTEAAASAGYPTLRAQMNAQSTFGWAGLLPPIVLNGLFAVWHSYELARGQA